MAGAQGNLSKFSSWPVTTLTTQCFLNSESWMWPRQGPLSGNANTNWKKTHQSFIIKKLYYWSLLLAWAQDYRCITLASQELSVQHSYHWGYRWSGEIIHVISDSGTYLVFHSFCLISLESESKADPCTQLLMKPLEWQEIATQLKSTLYLS